MSEPSFETVRRVGMAILEAHSQWEHENNRNRPGVQHPWTAPHLELLARTAIAALNQGGEP